MTRWLALAAVVILSAGVSYADGMTISISSGTGTVIQLPEDAQFVILPATPTICPVVTCPVVTCPTVAVSTGPTIMQSPIDGSCTTIDYVNPNSTCHNPQWIQCPQ